MQQYVDLVASATIKEPTDEFVLQRAKGLKGQAFFPIGLDRVAEGLGQSIGLAPQDTVILQRGHADQGAGYAIGFGRCG